MTGRRPAWFTAWDLRKARGVPSRFLGGEASSWKPEDLVSGR